MFLAFRKNTNASFYGIVEFKKYINRIADLIKNNNKTKIICDIKR
jgi:hypothetical protein